MTGESRDEALVPVRSSGDMGAPLASRKSLASWTVLRCMNVLFTSIM